MNFLLLGFGLYVCLETQAQPADGSKNGAACIGFCGKYCLDDHGMRKCFFSFMLILFYLFTLLFVFFGIQKSNF